jgi:hypothetical protein
LHAFLPAQACLGLAAKEHLPYKMFYEILNA